MYILTVVFFNKWTEIALPIMVPVPVIKIFIAINLFNFVEYLKNINITTF